MSITAKELAKRLGLSEAAVSMALNNKPGVSTLTRQRVLETAKQLDYDFSKKYTVTNLKKGTICFVIYKKNGAVVSDTPFFSILTDGISLKCKKEHYDLEIKYLYEEDNISEQVFRLSKAQYSGIILLATEMTFFSLSHFSGFQTPIVILDAYFETLQYNYVLINNVQGSYLAVEHLIRHRRMQPGYLCSSYSISNFLERADGFYKAIRANGMSTSKSIVHRLTPSEDGAYMDMKALIEDGAELAGCYFADNDHIAIGAIKAFKQAGFRIPDDIAVIGFDDLPLCEYLSPPLTTIHVPTRFLGETAAERLIHIMEARNCEPLKIEISTTLKCRKTD